MTITEGVGSSYFNSSTLDYLSSNMVCGIYNHVIVHMIILFTRAVRIFLSIFTVLYMVRLLNDEELSIYFLTGKVENFYFNCCLKLNSIRNWEMYKLQFQRFGFIIRNWNVGNIFPLQISTT